MNNLHKISFRIFLLRPTLPIRTTWHAWESLVPNVRRGLADSLHNLLMLTVWQQQHLRVAHNQEQPTAPDTITTATGWQIQLSTQPVGRQRPHLRIGRQGGLDHLIERRMRVLVPTVVAASTEQALDEPKPLANALRRLDGRAKLRIQVAPVVDNATHLAHRQVQPRLVRQHLMERDRTGTENQREVSTLRNRAVHVPGGVSRRDGKQLGGGLTV